MASVNQSPCALVPQQFPAGTPTDGVIRYVLMRASDGQMMQFKDVAPGNGASFTSVADGSYKVSAQRRTSGGTLLGSPVVTEAFTVDSTVTLDVPASISVPTVVI